MAILALSMAALVLMSVGAYLAFERQLRSSFDSTLRARAASYATLVDLGASPPSLRIAADPGAERANGQAVIRLFNADGTLLADGGTTVGSSAAEGRLVRAAITGHREALATVQYTEGERFRSIATPLFSSGQLSAVLVTGVETAAIDDPLAILRAVLVIAVPATSLGLALGAFLIARRSLQPVAAITAAAKRIAAGELEERISGIRTHDEVGELAATFNGMLDRLADTVERERRFTADAAHELRTPLSAMETGIEVTLSRPRDAETYRAALESVGGQAGRLVRLTRQLLLLSRLDAGQAGLVLYPVDLGGLISAMTETFREQHREASVDLHLPPSEVNIRGDLDTLARAFGNVLDNAVLHCGRRVHLDVAVSRTGAEARVRIGDNGPGMSRELVQTAFQRFSRGDSARTVSGSGLGLAIVEAIVRAHGGAVALASNNEGTTFEFTFPAV